MPLHRLGKTKEDERLYVDTCRNAITQTGKDKRR